MKRGPMVVMLLVGISGALALAAVVYLKQPENAVRGTFTLFHSLVFRSKRDEAIKIVAPKVIYRGREMTSAEFMAAFESPTEKGAPDISPCPSEPSHWRVLMADESTCFIESDGAWRLHSIAKGECACGTK